MRITQGMMHSQLIRNLNNNLNSLDRLNLQLTTKMKINKPSDDPVGITYSLRYRSELSANEQYMKNAESALSWLEFSDKAMQQVEDVIHRLQELVVKGASTNPQTALDAIKGEVDELKKQLVDIANSQINGKYVFNGQKTDQKPYNVDTAAADVTDSGNIQYELGTGVNVNLNIPGSDIFGPPVKPGEEETSDNLFAILDQLSDALAKGNNEKVGDQADKLSQRLNTILSAHAEVGARSNRVELMHDRLDGLRINLTELQSKVEDVDYSEAIMQYKIEESAYQASLSVGARIIMPSLLDYLR